jgi:gamma-glutamylcysteine synthetase
MTKYKEYFQRMVEENKDIFRDFTLLHANYIQDDEKYQDEFNTLGGKVLDIAHEWENRLCKSSEGAGYGTFTTKLAEKFQEELRRAFPMIDHVGIISVKSTFKLKKLL